MPGHRPLRREPAVNHADNYMVGLAAEYLVSSSVRAGDSELSKWIGECVGGHCHPNICFTSNNIFDDKAI